MEETNDVKSSQSVHNYEFLSKKKKDYFINRVDNQIDWYDKKSRDAQVKYKIFTYVIIVASAAIPVFTNLAIGEFWVKILVSLLGAGTTLSQGIINLNDYNTNWIEYRTVCETLKKEKYMFITNAGVYGNGDNDELFAYFAERIESIISQENLNWANIKKDEKGEN